MGRAPAYIFVVRHGNRLDAANKQWHLQSPTPYDPPLTYSGWNQARAVGQRIGQTLLERELQDEASATNAPAKRRRKYKVVIHSSPFLRCIQTSVGISAGLASIPEPAPPPARASSTHSVTNPRSRPTIITDIPLPPSESSSQPFAGSGLPTPPDTNSRPSSPSKPTIQKTVLRLDAFLGEWLTPGYFELITPPPGSSLMLASAKADLLRKEDYSKNPNFYTYNPPSNPASGQMWGQSPITTQPELGLENTGSLAEALRRAGRSDSISSNGESRLLTGGAYVSPTPPYALSHNAEIPKGYVPHARDNCCDIDYQWDSMRGSLDWGDGGSFGEEWTAMHKRFRKGLQKLVDWYSTADNPTAMVTKERRMSLAVDECAVEDYDDVETESVVILVSHGAGCNALIGAITHQPVLTDVGLASLTQAVRKAGKDEDMGGGRPGLNRMISASSTLSDPAPGLVPIHQYYDLRLFASTDHLSTSTSSRSSSITTNRGRLSNAPVSSPLGSGLFSNGSESRSCSAAANLGSMRRDSGSSSRLAGRIGMNANTNGLNGGGITVGSGVTSFLRPAPTSASAGGLWSPLRNNMDTMDEDDDDFLPNFNSFDIVTPSTPAEAAVGEAAKSAAEPSTLKTNGNGSGRNRSDSGVSPRAVAKPAPAPAPAPALAPAPAPSLHNGEEHNHVPPLPQLGSGTGGLWGSPKPLEENDIPRDLSSPKRRWTVNERWQG